VTLTERPRFLMVPGIGLAAEDWERTMGRLTSRGVDPRGPGGGAATGVRRPAHRRWPGPSADPRAATWLGPTALAGNRGARDARPGPLPCPPVVPDAANQEIAELLSMTGPAVLRE
jgi:hypothetical protein